MKSVLYVGATLMIGAGIYGFADYKKTGKSEAFKQMYNEVKKTAVEPEGVVLVTTNEPSKISDNKMNVAKSKEAKSKKTVTKKASKKVKRKREIKAEFFSRGGLDDRYIEPIELKEETNKK